MIKRIVSTLMISILIALGLGSIGCGSRKNVQTDPSQSKAEKAAAQAQEALRSIQGTSERVLAYTDIGEAAIAEIKSNEALKAVPELADVVALAESSLLDFKNTATPLHELSLKITELNLTNKEDLKLAFDAADEAMKKLRPQAERLVKLIARILKERGIVNVDMEGLQSKFDLFFSVVSGGLRIIKSRLTH